MNSLKILPILGLKTSVAPNDGSLFQSIGADTVATYCVDAINIDFQRIRNTCSKAMGHTEWSNTANASATKCLGLFELKGTSGNDHIFFDNGLVYIYDSSRDPIEKAAAAPVTFANTDGDIYSMIQYGDYIVFADRAEHEPYAWKNGDANLTILQDTTTYQFRYLELFQQRIIGAYSTATDGDIEIRWTARLPAVGTADFAAANQQYKETNDSITGIRNLVQNRCILYGDDSITAIDYYPDYTRPFSLTTMVTNGGFAGHHSIIPIHGVHYGFSSQYGFCIYDGSVSFPSGGKPISEPIEDKIATINSNYYSRIVGTYLKPKQQIMWAVPLNGVANPSHILIYDVVNNQWTIEEKATRYIDNWLITSNLTWTALVALGFTYWSSLGSASWGEYVTSQQRIVHANTNGKLYYHGGDSDAGSNFQAYRTEPMISLGNQQKAILNEVWIDLVTGGAFDLDIYYRGGNTVYECSNASFTQLPSINCNQPANPVSYANQAINKAYRYHQIKWGTDEANERFGVNAIILKYTPEGTY